MDDTISRQAAIEALERDMASLDHIIKGMSANDVRLDAYVSQRNQVNYDIYTINNLPAVQSEQLGTNLAEVGTDCISRQAAIAAIDECYCGGTDENGSPWIYKENAVEAIEMVEPSPSAEPKRETATVSVGKSKGGVTMRYECAACGEPVDQGDTFCSRCGRRLIHE